MAVAYSGTHLAATPATGSTFTSGSMSVSGTNPVIIIAVGANADSPFVVSSVSWSLGSGTPAEIKNVRQGTGAIASYTSVWAIPAPSAGSGTYTVNLSSSAPYQIDAMLFTGADQTTPCPLADAVSTTGSIGTSLTLTPGNVTASEASVGAAANTNAGDTTSFTPTQVYLDDTTAVNMEDGYRIGVGSVVANFNSGGEQSFVAVRIQVPASSGATQATTATPYIGLWSKDGVLAVGAFDVGIPIAYGLFDDGYVAQFSGTVYAANVNGVRSVPTCVFDRDADVIGMLGVF